MIAKRILCSKKIRKIPRQFSWLDHRLVREGHMSRCSHQALAFYLFLVAVSDAEGLSYYSDTTTCRLLNMDASELSRARQELCRAGLVAYAKPLYQVLALDAPETAGSAVSAPSSGGKEGEAISIGDILRQMAGGQA